MLWFRLGVVVASGTCFVTALVMLSSVLVMCVNPANGRAMNSDPYYNGTLMYYINVIVSQLAMVAGTIFGLILAFKVWRNNHQMDHKLRHLFSIWLLTLSTACLVNFILGILGTVNYRQPQEEIMSLYEIFAKYNQDVKFVGSFERYQRENSCCGINGPDDWMMAQLKQGSGGSAGGMGGMGGGFDSYMGSPSTGKCHLQPPTIPMGCGKKMMEDIHWTMVVYSCILIFETLTGIIAATLGWYCFFYWIEKEVIIIPEDEVSNLIVIEPESSTSSYSNVTATPSGSVLSGWSRSNYSTEGSRYSAYSNPNSRSKYSSQSGRYSRKSGSGLNRTSTNPYPPSGNPYYPSGNPYSPSGNPYSPSRNQYSPSGNLYSPSGNPYSPSGNPYPTPQETYSAFGGSKPPGGYGGYQQSFIPNTPRPPSASKFTKISNFNGVIPSIGGPHSAYLSMQMVDPNDEVETIHQNIQRIISHKKTLRSVSANDKRSPTPQDDIRLHQGQHAPSMNHQNSQHHNPHQPHNGHSYYPPPQTGESPYYTVDQSGYGGSEGASYFSSGVLNSMRSSRIHESLEGSYLGSESIQSQENPKKTKRVKKLHSFNHMLHKQEQALGGRVVAEMHIDHARDPTRMNSNLSMSHVAKGHRAHHATIALIKNRNPPKPKELFPGTEKGYGQTGHLATDILEMSGGAAAAKSMIDDINLRVEHDPGLTNGEPYLNKLRKEKKKKLGRVDHPDPDHPGHGPTAEIGGVLEAPSVDGSQAQLLVDNLFAPKPKPKHEDDEVIKPHEINETKGDENDNHHGTHGSHHHGAHGSHHNGEHGSRHHGAHGSHHHENHGSHHHENHGSHHHETHGHHGEHGSRHHEKHGSHHHETHGSRHHGEHGGHHHEKHGSHLHGTHGSHHHQHDTHGHHRPQSQHSNRNKAHSQYSQQHGHHHDQHSHHHGGGHHHGHHDNNAHSGHHAHGSQAHHHNHHHQHAHGNHHAGHHTGAPSMYYPPPTEVLYRSERPLE